nr:peptide deformylase [Oceaniglobus trochenteri]
MKWPDPVLSQVCAPVALFDAGLKALIDDMFATMYAAPGRGLAAPQVGRALRLFVMDVTWKEGTPSPFAFVNPQILWASDDLGTADEQCLSIPDVPMPVERPQTVRMRWQGHDGAWQEQELSGMAARCAQHELDHLDGIVIFDRVAPDLRAGLEAGYLA